LQHLTHKIVKWPAKGEFRISRSALTEFTTVQVFIHGSKFTGRAECRPYARYNETPDSVTRQIMDILPKIEAGADRNVVNELMPSGAARNAVDCALWDLEAKTHGKPVWDIAGIEKPSSRETAFTLSIDTPENMAGAAVSAKAHKYLKMKIGPSGGLKAAEAVLQARPDARLIVDANEALSPEELDEFSNLERAKQIAMIEQPFPASQDRKGLFPADQSIPICADESLHTSRDLNNLWDAGYRVVNVKLDKTGGLTEALRVMRQAKTMGFKIMAGCMVGSSLAMAPMVILESFADYIDLDGPLLLNDDFNPPLKYKGGKVFPPSKELWG